MRMLKRTFSFVLAVMLVFTMLPRLDLTARAAQETVLEEVSETVVAKTEPQEKTGNSLWEYAVYADGVELTAYNGTAADIYVPATVDGNAVIKLGDSLFEDNDAVNSVTLADGITQIGARTFYDADQLVCIVTNETLTTIGAEAFYSCDSFNSVILYDAVITIGNSAFAGCDQLTVYCNSTSSVYSYMQNNGISVVVLNPDAEPEVVVVENIIYHISNGEATLMSLVKIGDFRQEDTQVVIPSHVNGAPVTKINDSAFKHCWFRPLYSQYSSTWTVVLPETISYIGAYAFMSTSIQTVNIPSGVTRILDYTFSGCRYLYSIEIPTKLKWIGQYAFSELNLSSTPDLSEAEFVGYCAFSCSSIASVTYPVDAQMEDCVFSNCDSLVEVNIPYTENMIPYGMFEGCDNLERVWMSKNQDYWSSSFYECPKLVLCIQDADWWGEYYPPNSSADFVADPIPYHVVRDGQGPEFYEIDGITYFIHKDGAYLMYCDRSVQGVVEIPETVAGYPVVRINQCAFQSCADIYQVIMPDTVTFIGRHAFDGCGSLQFVDLSDSLYAIDRMSFSQTSSLETIEFPESLKIVGDYAFHYSGLKKTPSFEYVERIVYGAFSESGLEEVVYPIHAEVESMAFISCENLTSLIIPEGVTHVANVFAGCENVSTVIIPRSVTAIDDSTFSNMNPLMVLGVYSGSYGEEYALDNDHYFYDVETGDPTNVVQTIEQDGLKYVIVDGEAHVVGPTGSDRTYNIPQIVNGYTVTKIREKAFYEHYLDDVTLPDTITEIGRAAFDWTYLDSINIPKGLTEIAPSTFFWTNLRGVKLHEGITKIGSNAFDYSSLQALPDLTHVTQVDYRAFGHNNFTGTITVPAHITFGGNVFEGCSSIAKVIFEDGVTRITDSMFASCTELKTVVIPESVTEIATNAFQHCPKAILYVLEGSYGLEYAKTNGLEYFVLYNGENPEIHYGTGISGTVSYTDDTVAAGAAVEILYDDGTLKEKVTTDENGAYAFTYAEVGRYTIRVTDANGNTAAQTVAVKRMNAFDVFLAGDTDLTLKKAWTVSGTVLPAGAATVTLTDETGNLLAAVQTADGSFTLTGVPNGTYILTAETGSGKVSQEITVFDGSVSNILLQITAETATVWGYVEVEDRDLRHHRRNWVEVTIYNSEGIAVDKTRSDGDGKYEFTNLPLDEYTIVAQTAEMRPDHKGKGYDRSYTLTGYAYVDAQEAAVYQAEDIVLYEENDSKATISGKVTAHGEHQACEVILRNVFRHEVARYETGRNGKYAFKNIPDGLYIIMAVTESDGMGFTVVAVRNGKVCGETDITVYKSEKIKEREAQFHTDLDDCLDQEGARGRRARIAEEKRFYDGLSQKEKKQLSKEYVRRLNELVEWAAACEYQTGEGITVRDGGTVISGGELEDAHTVTFCIDVTKRTAWQTSTDGVNTREDFIQQEMEDVAGRREISAYYEITMTKSVDGQEHAITSVYKDTETTGKFRITMRIPEEYRGYKHYSFIHVHHGESVELVDLDNDPNTVTFEVDRFSTFALVGSNEEKTVTPVATDVTAETVYDSLEDAFLNAAAGSVVVLQRDVAENVTVSRELCLDLNGFDVSGTVTVAEGCTLYCMDSQTDDYTVEDGDGYGKLLSVSGNVEGLPAEAGIAADGYLMVTEADGISFHRVGLQITAMSLRAKNVGVYYTSTFCADEVAASKVKKFGVALSVVPDAEQEQSLFSEYTGFVSGKSATGTLLRNIMQSGNSDAVNAANAATPVYGRAYIETDDGYMFGACVVRSLEHQVEAVDRIWDQLTETQQLSVLEMYGQYIETMEDWDIPAIRSAFEDYTV